MPSSCSCTIDLSIVHRGEQKDCREDGWTAAAGHTPARSVVRNHPPGISAALLQRGCSLCATSWRNTSLTYCLSPYNCAVAASWLGSLWPKKCTGSADDSGSLGVVCDWVIVLQGLLRALGAEAETLQKIHVRIQRQLQNLEVGALHCAMTEQFFLGNN